MTKCSGLTFKTKIWIINLSFQMSAKIVLPSNSDPYFSKSRKEKIVAANLPSSVKEAQTRHCKIPVLYFNTVTSSECLCLKQSKELKILKLTLRKLSCLFLGFYNTKIIPASLLFLITLLVNISSRNKRYRM